MDYSKEIKNFSKKRIGGYVGNLTLQQEKILEIMREKYENWLKENKKEEIDVKWRIKMNEENTRDYLLLRFLRARNFDLEIAFKLLIDCIIWRETFQGIGVDNIKEETILNELKSGKAFAHGKDKTNHPIIYIKVRLHKKGVIDLTETQRFAVYLIEKNLHLMKPPIETSTLIFDMFDFSLQNMDYQFVKFLIELLSNRYPESLHLGLVVDSPWIFQACWKIIKPWVDSVTVSKIHFISKRDLLKHIDENELLEEYGGKDPYIYIYQENIPPN
jgi:hypothetical protein